jgi:hypothetical protein
MNFRYNDNALSPSVYVVFIRPQSIVIFERKHKILELGALVWFFSKSINVVTCVFIKLVQYDVYF